MNRAIVGLILVIGVGLAEVTIAGPLEDATAAYSRGDYTIAFRIWSALGDQGDATAQVRLGLMYETGRGIAKDDAQAVEWYRKAAEQGNASGENSLGYMYETGRGIAKDETQAVQWYRKAAEQGNDFGENNLGRAYRDGHSVARDDAVAVSWFRRAAEQGNGAGQTNLGYMYANGRGVTKDDTEAVRWYRKAADQGYALGENNLGVMYRDGRGVAKDDGLAVAWLRKAAEQGNALAQKNLAAMVEQGRDVLKSDAAAGAASAQMPATTSNERSTNFEVGRVTLRMPDDTWESVSTTRRGIPYTGDRSGEIPLVTRYLLLRDGAGKFRAVLAVRASWGVGGVRISWTQSCRAQQNTHVVLNARGDVADCLRVTGPIATQRYLELAAPDLMVELRGRGVNLPGTGYAVSDEIGLDNGTYVSVQAVFAGDFKLPHQARSQDDLPSGVKPEAVAWGASLAEAVRSSVYSLSGTLILPTIAGKAASP